MYYEEGAEFGGWRELSRIVIAWMHGGRRGPLWEKGTHPRSIHEYESSAGVADSGEIDNTNSLSSERVSAFEAFFTSRSRKDSLVVCIVVLWLIATQTRMKGSDGSD